MGAISIRNTVLLGLLSLYIVFNYGFMQVRIPPSVGSGIPIGELVLILSLLTINYLKLFPKLARTVCLWPFIIWWVFGIGTAFAGVPDYGMWALRDATHVIESLFLIVGFVFAAQPNAIGKFFRWLGMLSVFICIYALGYPFSDTLWRYSPVVIAGAGNQVPIFFTYTGTSAMVLFAISYFMLFSNYRGFQSNVLWVFITFMMGFTIFLFQARTVYLQVIALLLLFALFKRRVFKSGILILFVLAVFLITVPFLDLQITGRLGQDVSMDFIISHFMAIGGIESEGVEGAASGVGQRLTWWANIFDKLLYSVKTAIIGLGFGEPLTDFLVTGGVPVREPHNSYISIIGRLGLIGFISFVWMHYLLIKVWRSAHKMCIKINWQEGANRLLVLLIFFVLIWVNAIGEDAFEKPFFALPYYFFWGVVLRFYSHLKNGIIGPNENLQTTSSPLAGGNTIENPISS